MIAGVVVMPSGLPVSGVGVIPFGPVLLGLVTLFGVVLFGWYTCPGLVLLGWVTRPGSVLFGSRVMGVSAFGVCPFVVTLLGRAGLGEIGAFCPLVPSLLFGMMTPCCWAWSMHAWRALATRR
jgi:hypothetical protein